MKNPRIEKVLEELPELRQIAGTAPKIDSSDPRVSSQSDERITPIQFRGSFFTRFVEIRAVSDNTATPEQVTYLRMVKERFGLDLVSMSLELEDLFTQVYEAIDDKDPYDQLVLGRLALLDLEAVAPEARGLATSLDDATNHPLGIEAIGMHYWDSLNPLLEQTYDIISERSLNAPFLTR